MTGFVPRYETRDARAAAVAVRNNFVATLLIVLPALGAAQAPPCRFVQVAINPTAPGRVDLFSGNFGTTELRFMNEQLAGQVEVFPEPPFVVQSGKFNKICSFDGGVWVRNSVYLSADESTVVAKEFSGSNEWLSIYNIRTCKKIREIDVAHSTWNITDDGIRVQPSGAQKDAAAIRYHFSASCSPIRTGTSHGARGADGKP
jgi:hypothetical protein